MVRRVNHVAAYIDNSEHDGCYQGSQAVWARNGPEGNSCRVQPHRAVAVVGGAGDLVTTIHPSTSQTHQCLAADKADCFGSVTHVAVYARATLLSHQTAQGEQGNTTQHSLDFLAVYC